MKVMPWCIEWRSRAGPMIQLWLVFSESRDRYMPFNKWGHPPSLLNSMSKHVHLIVCPMILKLNNLSIHWKDSSKCRKCYSINVWRTVNTHTIHHTLRTTHHTPLSFTIYVTHTWSNWLRNLSLVTMLCHTDHNCLTRFLTQINPCEWRQCWEWGLRRLLSGRRSRDRGTITSSSKQEHCMISIWPAMTIPVYFWHLLFELYSQYLDERKLSRSSI